MGLFADIFLGAQCKFCGKRSLEDESSKGLFPFEVKYCNSCGRYQIHGHTPRCRSCGTPQTYFARNEYGVILPKCPNCGYVWDGEEYGE